LFQAFLLSLSYKQKTVKTTADNDKNNENRPEWADEVVLKFKSGVGALAVPFVVLLFDGTATGVGTAGVEGPGANDGAVSFTVGLATGVVVLFSTGSAVVGGTVGVTPTGGSVVGAGVATGGVVLKVPVRA
jgi:hypothetical protein